MDNKGRKVLIVDDEPNALKVLAAILRGDGYTVHAASTIEEATKIIRREDPDAIVTDIKMPGQDGVHLFEYTKEFHPEIPLIFLTAFGTVDSAVKAMADGAFYYFIKPPDFIKLRSILQRAVEQRLLKKEVQSLRKKLLEVPNFCRIVSNDAEMLKIFDTINTVKDSSSSILIYGETGTGKELIGRALHYTSKRKGRPFVAVNCAAIPSGLLESELFGFEKGAFTGAMSSRVGKIEEASGGTLFLDEIGELELALQAKLLRVLQENEIERLGSNKKIRVDFRLICSTNRDLNKLAEAGTFREDLFYRINVIQINVPPLRGRKEDIPLLASEFLKEFCCIENKSVGISDQAMEVFLKYHWPGNIRQLRNVIERAVVLSKGPEITIKELPEALTAADIPAQSAHPGGRSLRDLEVLAITEALKECKGNKAQAARILGISRTAFYSKLREFRLK